jgi:hypothetical protein
MVLRGQLRGRVGSRRNQSQSKADSIELSRPFSLNLTIETVARAKLLQ